MMTTTIAEFINYIIHRNGVKAAEWAKRVLDHMSDEDATYYITTVLNKPTKSLKE